MTRTVYDWARIGRPGGGDPFAFPASPIAGWSDGAGRSGVGVVFDFGFLVLGEIDLDDIVQADGVFDLLADLDHEVDVLGEERLHVLAALAELLAVVGEPRTRLLD